MGCARSRTAVLVGLGVAASLLLAGCSGSPDADSSSDRPSAATPSAASPSTSAPDKASPSASQSSSPAASSSPETTPADRGPAKVKITSTPKAKTKQQKAALYSAKTFIVAYENTFIQRKLDSDLYVVAPTLVQLDYTVSQMSGHGFAATSLAAQDGHC